MTNSNYLHGAVEQIQQVITNAEEQLLESKKVEHNNAEEYTSAQVELEEANMQLDRMIHSANPDQRDQLIRLQQQLHQLQNKMILGL
ncbi:DUF2524 family protein [Evansella cellulosilytica]|uniref:DUF2524 family protein n=1 Tax=Evansella cellulosilytica (strain ATCC 21833 / DSM 2522 / FERM P-1141 / JCM 9156 / N-4) TaxID=649639 RepID=E6TZL1_EVAC2|nr:DUF2524 family protein [Evansella cellulosilytica]ADU30185.1 Protein of unknown function DUF2524 [Evansella cellulosilytica DSM 2522]